jgi:hypothetical protein
VNARRQRGGFLPPAPQHRDFPLIPLPVQFRVALPTIGAEQNSRLDAILNEGVQARGSGVFNHLHRNPSNARSIGLGGYDDQDLLSVSVPARPSSSPPTRVFHPPRPSPSAAPDPAAASHVSTHSATSRQSHNSQTRVSATCSLELVYILRPPRPFTAFSGYCCQVATGPFFLRVNIGCMPLFLRVRKGKR